MDAVERDYQVARIVSGGLRCPVGGVDYAVEAPSRHARYLAEEVAREVARECEGLLDLEGSRRLLVERGLLEPEHDDRHEGLLKDVEEMKVALWRNRDDAPASGAIRKALGGGRGSLSSLRGRRDALYPWSSTAIVQAARARFLVGASLRLPGGSPYWDDPREGWGRPDAVVDAAMEVVARERATEAMIREVAREEPWASTWGAAKHAGRGLFDAAAADLTDEQRGLILWSRNYDAIREHPECPPDPAIRDDDALDGWLILRRRERESQQAKGRLDGVSDKVKNHQEVFLVATGPEDLAAIERLNSPGAVAQKQQRADHLRRNGRVNELAMPDTWARYQMAAAQATSAAVKGKR